MTSERAGRGASEQGNVKRSLTIAGHRTSVSLEEPFWAALGEIAAARGLAVSTLVREVDAGRGAQNLSSALRVFVLGAVNQLAAPMMARAFHGGREAEVGGILRRAMLWSALGSLPLFLVMFFFPEALLGLLFGQSFEGSADLLRVLALGQFVNASTGPVGFALLALQGVSELIKRVAALRGEVPAGELAAYEKPLQ